VTANPLVVTLGEVMGTFVARDRGPLAEATEFRAGMGGAEANVAIGLARLGVASAFIGRVGADGLGTAIMRRLRGEGVDVTHLQVDHEAATGVMIRESRDLGPSEVLYWRRGSAGSRLSAADVEAAAALFERATWLHVTGISPALSSSAAAAVDAAITRAAAAGATISLDINMRRKLWSEAEARAALGPMIARCRIVLGGVEELAVVAGVAETLDAGALADPEAVADGVLAEGPEVVVVRRGADGAIERRAGRTTVGPAHPVERIVDPVGAGDAFTAGYIFATLQGGPPADVLAAASACGAAVVATLGDVPGLPTREELGALLRHGPADTNR
jgi:2-dehydro-3-deoxygluconokinase